MVSMELSGVLGAGTPPKSMGAGKAKFPASGSIRRYGLDGSKTGSIPVKEPRPGGCTGGAPAGLFAKLVLQYTACIPHKSLP